MIMFHLFQDKSLTVKLFWRVDPKISMTSRVLWVFQYFHSVFWPQKFSFIIDQVRYFVACFFVIFMISALSRLFKFASNLSHVSISSCISTSNQSCELFFTRISWMGAI